jgi:hypothetical protein
MVVKDYHSIITELETRDYWWFNVSSPENLEPNDVLRFNLWDTKNTKLIKQVTIDLSKDKWFEKIQKASIHTYKGRDILKVHAYRDKRTKEFIMYFGRVTDGLYRI